MSWRGFLVTNTLAYWARSQVMMKIKCCEYGPWDSAHKTSFSSKLMDGSKKVECYIAQYWKGLLGPNTLSYWAYF